MASIRPYRTPSGQRRYEVRYRDGDGRQRSRAFTAHKDAQTFKLDVERKCQAGVLYQAPPERFRAVAAAWLKRYERGAAGNVRPRPRSIVLAHENLAALAPLNELSLERIRMPVVEDLVVSIAERGPRRAEMALALLKRILRAAEERGQVVDPAVYRVRIARHEEREPRFLIWEEAEEVRAWLPEHVCRIVPIAILTMLRRGEILGLRDRDVDFETGAIAVFAQSQDGVRVSPKTRTGPPDG
jgi:integrase